MEIVAFLLLLALFAGAIAGSYYVARYFHGVALFGLWAVLGVFSLTMGGLEADAPGLESITYTVVLLFVCLPTAVAFAIGSCVGLYKAKADREG